MSYGYWLTGQTIEGLKEPTKDIEVLDVTWIRIGTIINVKDNNKVTVRGSTSNIGLVSRKSSLENRQLITKKEVYDIVPAEEVYKYLTWKEVRDLLIIYRIQLEYDVDVKTSNIDTLIDEIKRGSNDIYKVNSTRRKYNNMDNKIVDRVERLRISNNLTESKWVHYGNSIIVNRDLKEIESVDDRDIPLIERLLKRAEIDSLLILRERVKDREIIPIRVVEKGIVEIATFDNGKTHVEKRDILWLLDKDKQDKLDFLTVGEDTIKIKTLLGDSTIDMRSTELNDMRETKKKMGKTIAKLRAIGKSSGLSITNDGVVRKVEIDESLSENNNITIDIPKLTAVKELGSKCIQKINSDVKINIPSNIIKISQTFIDGNKYDCMYDTNKISIDYYGDSSKVIRTLIKFMYNRFNCRKSIARYLFSEYDDTSILRFHKLSSIKDIIPLELSSNEFRIKDCENKYVMRVEYTENSIMDCLEKTGLPSVEEIADIFRPKVRMEIGDNYDIRDDIKLSLYDLMTIKISQTLIEVEKDSCIYTATEERFLPISKEIYRDLGEKFCKAMKILGYSSKDIQMIDFVSKRAIQSIEQKINSLTEVLKITKSASSIQRELFYKLDADAVKTVDVLSELCNSYKQRLTMKVMSVENEGQDGYDLYYEVETLDGKPIEGTQDIMFYVCHTGRTIEGWKKFKVDSKERLIDKIRVYIRVNGSIGQKEPVGKLLREINDIGCDNFEAVIIE